MSASDAQEVSRYISGVEHHLGIQVDADLERDHLAGQTWDELGPGISAIQKYLVGARSFVMQENAAAHGGPAVAYDTSSAARFVPLVRALYWALPSVVGKTRNHESRLELLREERDLPTFEAVLYELAVAARYAQHLNVKWLHFKEGMRGAADQTPGFVVSMDGAEWTVGCRKVDGSAHDSARLRGEMRELARPILEEFRRLDRSVVVELTLYVAPEFVPGGELVPAAVRALESGSPVVVSGRCVVAARALPPSHPFNYRRFNPSPAYAAFRFGHKVGGDFHGIAMAVGAVESADAPGSETVQWEAAVRWSVLDSRARWDRKKEWFARMFDGLEPPSEALRSILHVCYERDPSVDAQRDNLSKLMDELGVKPKAEWMIFNELILRADLGGNFEPIEHVYIAPDPQKTGLHPPVENVFVDYVDPYEGR